MTIRLLIDGYNLLHATGALNSVRNGEGLAKARHRMLAQIAAAFNDTERRDIQVVFDAPRKGPAPPDTLHQGIIVSFATGFSEADDLLEEIIRQHGAPHTLSVVSSDLRVQRYAKSRRATAIDCDSWLMSLLDRNPLPTKIEDEVESPTEKDEATQLSDEEVRQWLKEFGL